LYDNASAHAGTLQTRFYAEYQITVLPHQSSPYSTILTSSDYFDFQSSSIMRMKGHFFDNSTKIQSACTE